MAPTLHGCAARRACRRLRGIAFLIAAACAGPVAAEDATGWQWTIAPYAWGISTRIDSQFADAPGGTSRFDDILDTFDGGFQLHAEGSQGTWGGFADFTYLGLSDTRERPAFATETDFDVRLFEAAATWHPSPTRDAGLDLFAGLRYADFDFTARLFPTNPQLPVFDEHSAQTYSDVMLGARYTWTWSDRWALTLRGDGSWGQTDGTWNAGAILRYRMQSGEWLLGYRYLRADLPDHGDSLRVTVDGPEIGYGFRF